MSDYSRIIDHPHYQSKTRPHMSMIDRAAQFAPFAALSGYGEAVEETQRMTKERTILSEDAELETDRTLRFAIMTHAPVSVTYYVPDEQKEGGEYLTINGCIRKVSECGDAVIMEDGSVINMADIYEVVVQETI